MTSFVCLLRGINVGRAKRIAMADLRGLLERLGFSDVRTLLNSGNAVFRAGGGTAPAHANSIRAAIASDLGLDVPVVVLGAATFRTIVTKNPLVDDAEASPSRFLVGFVQDRTALSAAKPLLAQEWAPDSLVIGRDAAYISCASGLLESKLQDAFAKVMRDTVTSRNWATVRKIEAMLT